MLIMLLLPLSRVLYVLLALLPVTVPFRVQDSLDHPFAWLMLKYQEWLLLHIIAFLVNYCSCYKEQTVMSGIFVLNFGAKIQKCFKVRFFLVILKAIF